MSSYEKMSKTKDILLNEKKTRTIAFLTFNNKVNERPKSSLWPFF